MIKIFYPPGGYGHFLGSCLYYFTELNITNKINFKFDENGSSHSFQIVNKKEKIFKFGHFETLSIDEKDTAICLIPHKDHHLDYFDNQFYKHKHKDFVSYLEDLNIDSNKFAQWYVSPDKKNSAWVRREWVSFWIADCLANSYKKDNYTKHNKFSIGVQDLFDDFYLTLKNACDYLNLTIQCNINEIKNVHCDFVKKQKFHNVQKNVHSWVIDTIDGIDSMSPCITIFDEAYTQYLLRKHGYEIQCDGLDKFPKNSSQLHKIIYKIH